MAWLDSLRGLAATKSEIDQPIFAVDGKTVRRSHDRKKGLGSLHSVSVWASEYGLSLRQVACDDKSNEITAIPELLRMNDIKGAIITIDAMGMQETIAAQIIKQEADYVLALNGNQEKMREAVVEYISDLIENDFERVSERRFETIELKHGREEVRCYTQLAVPDDLPNREYWDGIKTIGMVISGCTRDVKEIVKIRYYISSLRWESNDSHVLYDVTGPSRVPVIGAAIGRSAKMNRVSV